MAFPAFAKIMVYRSPDERSPVVHTLTKGDKVKVVKKVGTWVEVKVKTRDNRILSGYAQKPKRSPRGSSSTGGTAFFWQSNWPKGMSYFEAGLEGGYYNLSYDLKGTPLNSQQEDVVAFSFYGLAFGAPFRLEVVTFSQIPLTIGLDLRYRFGLVRLKLTDGDPKIIGRSLEISSHLVQLATRAAYQPPITGPFKLKIIGGVGAQLYMIQPSFKMIDGASNAYFVDQTEISPFLVFALRANYHFSDSFELGGEFGDRLYLSSLSSYSETPSGSAGSGSSPRAKDFLTYLNPWGDITAGFAINDRVQLRFGAMAEYFSSGYKFSGTGHHSRQAGFTNARNTFGYWNVGGKAGLGLSW